MINALDQIYLPLFAFTAGAAAFLNPCGIALLPTYVALYLGVSPEALDTKRRGLSLIIKAAMLGLLATAGFMTVFLGVGSIMSIIGLWLIRYVPILALILGIASILLGLLMATGKTIVLPITGLDPSKLAGSGIKYFPLFGIAYAIASLSCTAPIFLYVALQAIAIGGSAAIAVFAAYSLGMGTSMAMFTLFLTLASNLVKPVLSWLARHYLRIAGLAIAAGGIYIVYWQVIVGGLAAP